MPSMERWLGRVALVTGATAGIGAAVARNLARNGMKVVGCGRRMEKLQELTEELKESKGSFHGIECDLTSEPQILAMFEKIKAEHGGVDVLVNNAGLAHTAHLLTGQTNDWKNMLDVNVLALCVCTREAFQSMKSRNVDDGHIINISSMSGHRVIASKDTHFYSATKHAVRAIGEGIRNELRELKSNIRLSTVSPGMVETEFAGAMLGDKDKANDVYALFKAVSPGIVETEFMYHIHESKPEKADKFYKSLKCLQSEDIADSVEYILSAPPHVQIHDVLMRPTEQKS